MTPAFRRPATLLVAVMAGKASLGTSFAGATAKAMLPPRDQSAARETGRLQLPAGFSVLKGWPMRSWKNP